MLSISSQALTAPFIAWYFMISSLYLLYFTNDFLSLSNEKYKTAIFYYYILQSIHNQQGLSRYRSQNFLKSTVMQIEKALINNPLRVSKVS